MFCACFLNMRACSLSPFCKERSRFFFPDLYSFSVNAHLHWGTGKGMHATPHHSVQP